jgi:hypothetical protein
MNFKEYTKLHDVKLAENVNMNDFVKKVSSFSNIDDAMLSLPDEYVEWYLLNINNKKLHKLLKKLNINEDDLTLGYAPSRTRIIKNIRYKGQYITIEYDPELSNWFPSIRFRSIVSALKYIKKEVDYDEENI